MKQLPFEIYHILIYSAWVVLAPLSLTVSKSLCLTSTGRAQGNFIFMHVKVSVFPPANVHNSLGFGGIYCVCFTEATKNLPPANYFSSNFFLLESAGQAKQKKMNVLCFQK